MQKSPPRVGSRGSSSHVLMVAVMTLRVSSSVSKLLEKVVAKDLSQRLLDNKLHEPFQSACWTCHSTD